MLGDPDRQRAPSAAKVQDALPIREFCALTAEREHGLFGLGQVVHAVGPQPTAVLVPRTQDVFEEGRRHFVVLFICELRKRGDCTRTSFVTKCPLDPICGLEVIAVDVIQAARQQPTDSCAHHNVGNVPGFYEIDTQHSRFLFSLSPIIGWRTERTLATREPGQKPVLMQCLVIMVTEHCRALTYCQDLI